MAATTALVVGAAASAYSANQQSKAANKAAKAANQPQEFSRTENPYLSDQLQPHINTILGKQAELFNNTFNSGAAPAPTPAPAPAPKGKGKGKGGAQVPAPAPTAGGKGKGKGAGQPAAQVAPKGPNLNTANGVLSEVARRGLDAGNSKLVDDASDFTSGVLNSSNFEGRNDILHDLNQRLGNADFDQPTNLLLGFLGTDGDGAGSTKSGSSSSAARPSRSSSGGGNAIYRPSGYSATAGPAGYSGGYSGSPVPDATGNGTFGKEIRDILEAAKRNPADDPTLAPMIESLRREALEGHQRSTADLDARMEAAGRFGGGAWADARSLANEEFDEGMQSSVANIYMNSRQSALDRALSALGLVNNRDIAAMSDATQREGIAASSAASSAGLAAQADLARRGQDLEAINSLMRHQEFGLSTLGSLGSQLSDDQFKALGSVGDIEGIGLSGLNIAGSAGNAMAGLQGSLAATNAQRGVANAQLNFERTKYNNALPQMQLDNYLRTIGLIGGMGGTSSGVNPGANMPLTNTTAATLMGGLGGAMSMYGLQNGGR